MSRGDCRRCFWDSCPVTALQLYLVRHAQAAASDEEDPPLSELGRSQASALGARLARTGVARVQHSPRRRAEQTASIIADAVPDTQVVATTHAFVIGWIV